jgi:alpha-glucosidase (family GH31 glycosyl hydrolase)
MLTPDKYKEFRTVNNRLRDAVGIYFEKYVSNSEDIGIVNIWFEEDELVIFCFDEKDDVQFTHTVNITEFFSYYNNEYIYNRLD